jgi:hypothetical protein
VTAWCSRSVMARAPRTAQSCFRHSFSASCEPTGAWQDQRIGSFPCSATIWMRARQSALTLAGVAL